jgi:hypothetical protein
VFVPVPPRSNQPEPEPPDESGETADTDAASDDDEAPELDLPPLRRPTTWPAVVRWARLCRVLAYISLIIFGILTARNLYLVVNNEPQFGPFQPPISPAVFLGYALLCAILGVASCISLLGFAELLHVFMSIEAAASHRSRDRSPLGE